MLFVLLMRSVVFWCAGMALVGRGRLSVQPVEPAAWDAVCALAEKGGFEDLLPGGGAGAKAKGGAKNGAKGKKKLPKEEDGEAERLESQEVDEDDAAGDAGAKPKGRGGGRKRKAEVALTEDDDEPPRRRSARHK
jgi:hypothetical protein